MAGSAAPGVLYGEVSAGWTPAAPVALASFHGCGANEQDLAPHGPMLAPALPWAALRARSGWFPAAMRGSRPSRLATGIRPRHRRRLQWIDAHMAPDARVAAVGFS